MDITVNEAAHRFPEMVERAENGESVTITREGRPVATLTGAPRKPTREQIDAVLREIDRAKRDLPPISIDDILDSIRDGRRM